MPDVKVYIREKNLPAWKKLTNKSEWVNTLLEDFSSEGIFEQEKKKATDAYRLHEDKRMLKLLNQLPALEAELIKEAGLEYRGEEGWVYDPKTDKNRPYTTSQGKLVLG